MNQLRAEAIGHSLPKQAPKPVFSRIKIYLVFVLKYVTGNLDSSTLIFIHYFRFFIKSLSDYKNWLLNICCYFKIGKKSKEKETETAYAYIILTGVSLNIVYKMDNGLHSLFTVKEVFFLLGKYFK